MLARSFITPLSKNNVRIRRGPEVAVSVNCLHNKFSVRRSYLRSSFLMIRSLLPIHSKKKVNRVESPHHLSYFAGRSTHENHQTAQTITGSYGEALSVFPHPMRRDPLIGSPLLYHFPKRVPHAMAIWVLIKVPHFHRHYSSYSRFQRPGLHSSLH
ncbi:hypothetical protein BS50DRAFT_341023 [Corynespora cassiicola Philippines]|uniref:Uncharacterized protein n=1 Tax=Corynespora cassiicola Philippines TaxID=1448308 RepID=A0A2T2NVF8_CORCC|nr:hypothetical protein BS50DRAFT_341023 [Corynespora cassiicola Philippines]